MRVWFRKQEKAERGNHRNAESELGYKTEERFNNEFSAGGGMKKEPIKNCEFRGGLEITHFTSHQKKTDDKEEEDVNFETETYDIDRKMKI